MVIHRSLRLGAGISVLALSLEIGAVDTARSDVTVAQQATSAPNTIQVPVGVTPIPNRGRRLNRGQPTPFPLSTIGPLQPPGQLQYPAYGTPVPGVGVGVRATDLPAQITLEQAIAIGFARSPSLLLARGDVEVQEAAVRLQRAGLLPSVSVTSGLNLEHIQPGGNTTSVVTTGTGTTTGAATNQQTIFTSNSNGLSISQLIYDGGRIAAAVNAARRTEVATADTYRRDLQTVANNVAQGYYAYLSAQRTTQVDLEIVREDQVQVDLVRAQVAAGTVAQADVATVLLPLAQARLAVVRAQGTELSAEATFMNAMGLDANLNVQPIDDAPVFTNNAINSVPIPTYDKAIARAIALRPDYDSAVQTVKYAQYNLKYASLGMFPTLSSSASAAVDTSDGAFGAYRNSQTVGLSLSVPIYDQGITAANVASARGTLNIENATLQQTLLGVQLSVKQALTNLVSSQAALVQTQQEYATAIVNVQSTQAQYRAGVTTLPLLLNAQVQLTQALTDEVTSVYALREAEQTYLYSIGANDVTLIGDAPLEYRPTPNPQPSGTAAPTSSAATPLPIPSQPVGPLPSPSPTATASPGVSPVPSGLPTTPAPHRRRLF